MTVWRLVTQRFGPEKKRKGQISSGASIGKCGSFGLETTRAKGHQPKRNPSPRVARRRVLRQRMGTEESVSPGFSPSAATKSASGNTDAELVEHPCLRSMHWTSVQNNNISLPRSRQSRQ